MSQLLNIYFYTFVAILLQTYSVTGELKRQLDPNDVFSTWMTQLPGRLRHGYWDISGYTPMDEWIVNNEFYVSLRPNADDHVGCILPYLNATGLSTFSNSTPFSFADKEQEGHHALHFATASDEILFQFDIYCEGNVNDSIVYFMGTFEMAGSSYRRNVTYDVEELYVGTENNTFVIGGVDSHSAEILDVTSYLNMSEAQDSVKQLFEDYNLIVEVEHKVQYAIHHEYQYEELKLGIELLERVQSKMH